MDKESQKRYEISRILIRHLDGLASPDDFQHLESMITENPEARRYYLEYMMMAVCLREKKIFSPDQSKNEIVRSFDHDLWAVLLEEERNAPKLPLKQAKPTPVPITLVRDKKNVRHINKLSLTAAILSAAALIFIIVYTNFVPMPTIEPVAEVIDTYNTVWQDASLAPHRGSVLYNTDSQQYLQSGLLKIRFETDAEVILEGPARYTCIAPDQMILSSGKAYAYVPLSASGFMIRTPASKIIDLGTEFGIEVDNCGNSLVQMYKGKASLIWGRPGSNLQNETLTENNTAQVNAATGQLENTVYDETAFVRRLDSSQNLRWRGESLNLDDIVGGGNGLSSGLTEAGIRWDNGQIALLREYYPQKTVIGPEGFIPTRQYPFIEGIFVPNGTNGPIAIADHDALFWDAPATDGRIVYNIHNSGMLIRSGTKHIQKFAGQLCGTPENPIISMHANAAITFNLEEIRKFYADTPLTSFTSLCGYSETVLKYAKKTTTADFYVLVDGQERFTKIDMTPYDEPCSIHIKLKPTDRYLTLVTTRGKEGKNSFDWCLFAKPQLHFR